MALIELSNTYRILLLERVADAFGTENALEQWLDNHRPEWAVLLEAEENLNLQLKKLLERLEGKIDWYDTEQFACLLEAILAAYPTPADFDYFSELQMGEGFTPVGGNYKPALLDHMRRVRSKGDLDLLVRKAKEDKPRNPKLMQLRASREDSTADDDQLVEFLQLLADHPPGDAARLRRTLEIISNKRIIASQQRVGRYFAGIQPFINRATFHGHLAKLGRQNPSGPELILFVQGKARHGKSLALTYASKWKPDGSPERIDFEDYSTSGQQVDAGELAYLLSGRRARYPNYDPSKEAYFTPHLIDWLIKQLDGDLVWLLVDHCNRSVLTTEARKLFQAFVRRVSEQALPNVRLILADLAAEDFGTREPWALYVPTDQADLPTRSHFRDWCLGFADSLDVDLPADQPDRWVAQVFDALPDRGSNPPDDAWDFEFNRLLCGVVQDIKGLADQQGAKP